MLYLSGLAETLALIDTENALEPGSHNLNVRSIARVLRAWGDFEGRPGLAGLSWSFVTVAASTPKATRMGPIGDLTLACQSWRYPLTASCRSCQRTTTHSCLAGSRISPS
jgi:hypothetical protein